MDLIDRKDDYWGLDYVGIYLGNQTIYGDFEYSPIETRFVKQFNCNPIDYTSYKPFKAEWMISENKLFIGIANGFYNGKRLFTKDIITEFTDKDLLIHYKIFSGIINVINSNSGKYILVIKKGMLTSIEKEVIQVDLAK